MERIRLCALSVLIADSTTSSVRVQGCSCTIWPWSGTDHARRNIGRARVRGLLRPATRRLACGASCAISTLRASRRRNQATWAQVTTAWLDFCTRPKLLGARRQSHRQRIRRSLGRWAQAWPRSFLLECLHPRMVGLSQRSPSSSCTMRMSHLIGRKTGVDEAFEMVTVDRPHVA